MDNTELKVGPRIKRISNALDRKRTLDMEDMELTSTQGLVLGYLVRHREEALSPGDIGRHFGLAHPTVTGILQRLEAKGFLAYAEDPSDRRRKRIAVTSKALERHQQVVERILETESQMVRGLTQDQQTQLLVLLDKVIANMDAGGTCCSGRQIKEESHD